MKKWDVIVIGSGVGGLVVAALLAKVHRRRVLVLERHSKAGGFTHTFRRKKYEFDVGVHYVGELHEGSEIRSVLKFLTLDRLQWRQLPHEFEHLIFDDRDWAVPSSVDEHRSRLQKEFPQQKAALNSYFEIERETAEAYGLWQFSEKFAWPLRKATRVYLQRFRQPLFGYTSDFMSEHFSDPRLRRLLTARWLGFGLPPEKSSFGVHCVQSRHYGQGAWYPRDGGASLAESLTAMIKAFGGSVLMNAPVESILHEKGRVRGVRLSQPLDGETEILAESVISNAGARNTYLNLLAEDSAVDFRKALAQSEEGTSVIALSMGLLDSPRKWGFDSKNYWLCPESCSGLFDPFNHKITAATRFLSFPSLKMGSSAHTAQVLMMTPAGSFKQWDHTKWRRRPQDYENLKEDLIRQIINDLDDRYPGFRQSVEIAELSTPKTVEHFHAHPGGSIYGVPSDPNRLRAPWAQTRTPISGLFLTGCDAFAPGISGAIFGALKTFQIVEQSWTGSFAKKWSRTPSHGYASGTQEPREKDHL